MAEASLVRRIIVFARVPQLGRVKTRLARTIGDPEALAVHRELLECALSTAARASPASLELCIAGADFDGECARLAHQHGASLASQRGGSLGDRMRRALARALAVGARPVLIGSDVPSLTVADLHAAFEGLDRHEMVFAPAEDGGYALVGCRRSVPAAAFESIAWGTASVMTETRERMREAQIDWMELRTVWDVDDATDLARWRALEGAGDGA